MSEPLPLSAFLDVLSDELGVDLRGYKHTTLGRRLQKRMQQVGTGDYAEYLERLRGEPAEKKRLLETVLINVTEFFRDPPAWEIIRQDVLPSLFKKKKTGDSFRAWVAGCASGEEVYSLGILVADMLGARLPEFDVKIYATDSDEDALNAARRGEYFSDQLRRVDPRLRSRYFQGDNIVRVNREIRKLVIFGKSDIVRDAPISHVELIVCRNVLIYFDSLTQKHVLNRLHYALDEGGVLFLGKAESKLSDSKLFVPIDSRWRIFRRDGQARAGLGEPIVEDNVSKDGDVLLLRTFQNTILEILEPGVILLDANDVVIAENESAKRLWHLGNASLLSRPILNTSLAIRCPELMSHLAEIKDAQRQITFQCRVGNEVDRHDLEVSLRPISDRERKRVGTLILTEDVSHRERLQHTVQQLEQTSEELQSANEELETTNEELQSTNEELETTNEELQSTNEELETTNEELQSLNEELENMNEELEHRTKELDILNSRYANTLEQMPWAVMLVDRAGRIQFWNTAASHFFNLQPSAVVGLELPQLPIQNAMRQSLVRTFRRVLATNRPSLIRLQEYEVGARTVSVQIHLSPVGTNAADQHVLIMFGTSEGPVGKRQRTKPNETAPSRKKASSSKVRASKKRKA